MESFSTAKMVVMESELDLEVLDRLQKLGGEGLISAMITLFIPHAESAIRDAANALAAGDFDSVRDAAHSLKSSAGNVGALQVQRLADKMEEMAKRKTGEIQPVLSDLENAYLRAKGRLTEEIRERKRSFENPDR